MITLVYLQDDLLKLVNNETVTLSTPVGDKPTVSAMRIADIIPLTNDNIDWFRKTLYAAATRVQQKLAYYMKDIEAPFIVSYPGDPDFPDPMVLYRVDIPGNENQILPMLQQSVSESLLLYVVKEWLTIKGYMNPVAMLEQKYSDAIGEIKSMAQYGQRAKTKYTML